MQTNKKINIEGHEINYSFRKGSGDYTICFLHGYPTSGEEYFAVANLIPEVYSVLIHDFLGFGRSDKPRNHKYLLTDQTDISLSLYESLDIKKVHLVAHDYGTSVATEMIARNNKSNLKIEIQSVTLCNGSMLIDMADLRFIQKLLKNRIFGTVIAQFLFSKTFHRNMRNIWFDKSKYNQDEMNIHWDLLTSKQGKYVLPKITRYIDQRYENYERWIGSLEESKLPFHILWAVNDPVAVVGMAHKLDQIITNSTLTLIDNCGHYPMIEEREKWTNLMLDRISQIEKNL